MQRQCRKTLRPWATIAIMPMLLSSYAMADNSDTRLTEQYAMNVYNLICKNWKQGKPQSIVEVINNKKGNQSYYLEDQGEVGDISSTLSDMSDRPFADEDIDKDIASFLRGKKQYTSMETARAASCGDVQTAKKPSQGGSQTPRSAQKPQQNDLATVTCMANRPRIAMAVNFRRQGMPIAYAERTVDNMRSNDQRLIRYLYLSVQKAYERPNDMERILNNGEWVSVCADYLRGF